MARTRDDRRIQLHDRQEQLARNPKHVQAKLYFQAIPPYYLNDRFNNPIQPEFPPGHKMTDTERLYWITSRLNVNIQDGNNEEFIKDWKLQVGGTASEMIVETPLGACCVGTICSVETQADCVALNGSFQGDDTACLLGTCEFRQPARAASASPAL